ncbi:MAG: efflux RND transporter permease subunit [Planctomycetota bacterium]
MSNYATINVKDVLARIPGVGDVQFLGPRDYSMRIWLDPTKLAAKSMTANDVVAAVQEQNIQVAAGRLGQPPAPPGINLQLTLNTLGRLKSEKEFGNIVVKTDTDGSVVYLRRHDRGSQGPARGSNWGRRITTSTATWTASPPSRSPCSNFPVPMRSKPRTRSARP